MEKSWKCRPNAESGLPEEDYSSRTLLIVVLGGIGVMLTCLVVILVYVRRLQRQGKLNTVEDSPGTAGSESGMWTLQWIGRHLYDGLLESTGDGHGHGHGHGDGDGHGHGHRHSYEAYTGDVHLVSWCWW